MKNKEHWIPAHYNKDHKGRINGTHMHKIIGHAYDKVIAKYSTGVLADVGCGNVPYYCIYKDLIKDNICIDWAKEETGISHLDYTADLNLAIPLESESVDTVLCTDVLEHINNPDLLFSEMTRIMKKGSYMILTVPFLYWVHSAPYDYHRYTSFMLEEFCRRNKLQLVSLEAYGGLPEILYDLVYKGYIFYNFPLRRPFLFVWRKIGKFLYNRNFVKR